MSALNYLIRQAKYLTVATAMFFIMLFGGGLTYQWIADVLGMAPSHVVFGFVIAWLLAMNRYNAYLNANARASAEGEADA